MKLRRSALIANRTQKTAIHRAIFLMAQSMLCFAGGAVQAGAIPLAQQPAGSAGREPAPNVIISIDDSGSMSSAVGGGNNASKMSVLKSALITQFGNPSANPPTKGKVEDGRIRLAWQSMCRNPTEIPAGGVNSMKPFSGTHRTNFYNYIQDLTPYCGTWSHKMVRQAYNYMIGKKDANSPWSDNPGTDQSTPFMACRRAYHIFMTDGEWNQFDKDETTRKDSVNNFDGVPHILGDGTTSYNPTIGDQLRVYADNWGTNKVSTLADWTFKAWATDLQDGSAATQNMPNNIQPLIRKSGNETVGGTVLQEYWNPKNNPATWQHIVTHTIGFGSGATSWYGQPTWATNNDNYGGGYPNIVNGTFTWPNPLEGNKTTELWHMALNGRGKFYPAVDANALSTAFAEILDNVINDTSKPVVSVSANSSRIRTGTALYAAGYDGKSWSGYLKAFPVSITGVGSTESWNSATLLDAKTPSSRVILSHNGTNGIPFQWSNMPSASPYAFQALLNSTDGKGSDRVAYIRGARDKEGVDATTFRNRSSVLGDIVNSNAWYLAGPVAGSQIAGYSAFASTNKNRTPMVYIGANDGMLHGFQASDGQEKIAYVPLGSYPQLLNYTSQGYTHKYFVDSSPFSGDVKVGSDWKTHLAGFLGGGGKGYFVLDVTSPSNFSEGSAGDLVVLDKTDPATMDPDVGHIYAQPAKDPAYSSRNVQFVMMNNNRPAILMGNGVNSVNETAVLLIQYLDGAKELVKLATPSTAGQGNGLMNPQVLDVNNDGKADLVYAGDLLGNLWKFDISGATSGTWKVSFGTKPLFSAKDSGGRPQPILVAPIWLTHPLGGIQLGVSTGRNFTTGDRTDTSEQTFYSVWDNSKLTFGVASVVTIEDDDTKRITSGRAALVKETMGASAVAALGGSSFYDYTPVKVNYTGTGTEPLNRRGWYMNFSISGERGSNNPSWYSGNFVIVPSAVPAQGTDSAAETCSLASKLELGYLTIVDLISGAPPKKPVFDTNGGGFTGSEVNASKISNVGDSVVFESGGGKKDLVDVNKLPCTTGNCGTGMLDPIAGGLTTGWRER